MCLIKYIQDKKDLSLLITRILIGVIFIVHGYQKFGIGFEAVGEFLSKIGIPASSFFAYFLPLVEFLGGIFLILGLFSRLFAFLLSVVMVVAILVVKINVGLVASGGGSGAELDLALLAGLVAILFQGPGKYSLELGLIKKELI